SAAFTRRWVASSISWGGRCAAPATITKEGTTTKCYPSPEYKVSPIIWTVHPAESRFNTLHRLLWLETTDPRCNVSEALLIHPDVLNIDALARFETPKPRHVDDAHEMTPDVPGSCSFARDDAVPLLFAPVLNGPYCRCHSAERLGRHA